MLNFVSKAGLSFALIGILSVIINLKYNDDIIVPVLTVCLGLTAFVIFE